MSIFKSHFRGQIYALALTMTAILVLTLIVKSSGLTDATIAPIVQCVKALSIFLGTLTTLRAIEKRAWLHGATLGLVYTALAFLILSIMDNNFSVTSGLLFEALFAALVGTLSAFILRLRKKSF